MMTVLEAASPAHVLDTKPVSLPTMRISSSHLVIDLPQALSSLGPFVESNAGHARFLAIYALSAISGSLASYMFSPNPSVGASGAMLGRFSSPPFPMEVHECMPSIAGPRLTDTACVLVAGAIFGLGSALALILHRHRDANKGFSEVLSSKLKETWRRSAGSWYHTQQCASHLHVQKSWRPGP